MTASKWGNQMLDGLRRLLMTHTAQPLAVACCILLSVVLVAQNDDKRIVLAPAPARRVALVIGNRHYKHISEVVPAINDRDDLAQTLRDLKFDSVTVAKDLTADGLAAAVTQFGRTIVKPGDLAFVYFSGHGVSVGDENYLLPVDFDPPDYPELVERGAYRMSSLRDAIERSGARVRVLVFDACRNAAATTAKGRSGGFAAIDARPEGTLIAYASAHNQTAQYRSGDRNSYYTAELIAALRTGGLDLKAMLEVAQHRVYERTNERQIPYLYGFLSAPVYLNGMIPIGTAIVAAGPPQPVPSPVREASGVVQSSDMLVSKDVGALTVGLKSVLPVRIRNAAGLELVGLQCTFEFGNRDPQRLIAIALNANPGSPPPMGGGGENIFSTSWGVVTKEGTVPGNVVRSKILDDQGSNWTLASKDVSGVGVVSVGKRTSLSAAGPGEIASLLQRRERSGTNMSTEDDPRLQGMGLPPFPFVWGEATSIDPGTSTTVSMTFVRASNASPQLSRVFTLTSEIVVGVTNRGKSAYALRTLTLDKVGMPAF